jgi:hypothetical protein
MSKRRSKRILEITQQYEDTVVKKAIEDSFEQVEDNQLFVLDREGSQAKRRRVIKELLPKAQKTYISPSEQKVIQKLAKSNKKGKYGDNIVEKARTKKVVSNVHDVWMDNIADLVEEEMGAEAAAIQEVTNKLANISKRKKMRVPLPGQSYHPDPKDHQNLLAEAVAIEMKLKETLAKASSVPSMIVLPQEFSAASFHMNSQAAKDLTNLLLSSSAQNEKDQSAEMSGSDDEEDNSDSDGEEEEQDENGSVIPTNAQRRKRKEKLTQAQLNRKKAVKLANYEVKKSKKDAEVQKKLDQLPNYLSELEKHEEERKSEKQLRNFLLKQKLKTQENKAISLSEIKALEKTRKSLRYKKKIGEENKPETEENEDEEEMEEVAEEPSLKFHDLSTIPLTDELNNSLRKVIPKGIAVKDYMNEMISNGYVNSKRTKGFKVRDNPYLPKKVKWIPKYKYDK